MKGASLFISFVLMMLIVFAIGMIIGPWMINLSTKISQQTEETAMSKVICQEAAYDFDPDYGIDGVDWNFTGADDTLSVKIKNTGTQNLYDFSFEITVNRNITHFNVTYDTQKTESDPLKPGESCILWANITENLPNNLENVKVLNSVCPTLYIDVDL